MSVHLKYLKYFLKCCIQILICCNFNVSFVAKRNHIDIMKLLWSCVLLNYNVNFKYVGAVLEERTACKSYNY